MDLMIIGVIVQGVEHASDDFLVLSIPEGLVQLIDQADQKFVISINGFNAGVEFIFPV